MSILDFLIELADYFRDKDYSVPSTFERDVLTLLKDLLEKHSSIFDCDLYELEPYIATFIVKDAQQSSAFHDDYTWFIDYFDVPEIAAISASDAKRLKSDYEQAKQQESNVSTAITAKTQQAQRLEKQLTSKPQQSLPERTIKKKQAEFEKIKDIYKKLARGLDKRLVNFTRYLDDISKLSRAHSQKNQPLMEDLSILLDRSFSSERAPELLKYIEWQISIVGKADKTASTDTEKLRRQKESLDTEIKNLTKEAESYKRFVDENREKYAAANKLIRKETSKAHRPEFTGGHNAVQSSYIGDIADREFNKLSEYEKVRINSYIAENAVEMRTRLARNIRTRQKRFIDMKETIKSACSTGGVPIRLMYKKPKKEKVNLLLFMDISGSCKNATEMMMCFAHAMQQAFPGGCRSYVFVNSLYDVSSFFDSTDTQAAMKAIHKRVPTLGVYSDYFTPLRQFCTEHLNEVDKNTLVFFIGDARNNNNPAGEDCMKEISRKARKTFFLNTEEKGKWNTGDSIAGIYSRYMDNTFETITPKQLINVVMSIR